jgi:hypothetical protein
MSNDLMLDIGQANELKLAFRRADYNNDDIKRLCEGNVLADVRRVLLGHASIAVVSHVIDCDKDPYLPEGWKVEEHQKGGQLIWDASKVNLYLSEGQKNGKVLEGNKLRKEMAKKVPFNACVLDYLLANPHLIPEEWKGKYVFFWGTVYLRGGDLCVRYLCWRGVGWFWSRYWLGGDWDGYGPAALGAS